MFTTQVYHITSSTLTGYSIVSEKIMGKIYLYKIKLIQLKIKKINAKKTGYKYYHNISIKIWFKSYTAYILNVMPFVFRFDIIAFFFFLFFNHAIWHSHYTHLQSWYNCTQTAEYFKKSSTWNFVCNGTIVLFNV